MKNRAGFLCTNLKALGPDTGSESSSVLWIGIESVICHWYGCKSHEYSSRMFDMSATSKSTGTNQRLFGTTWKKAEDLDTFKFQPEKMSSLPNIPNSYIIIYQSSQIKTCSPYLSFIQLSILFEFRECLFLCCVWISRTHTKDSL